MPSRTLRLATLALLLYPRLASAQGVEVDHEAETQFRLGLDAANHGHAEEARIHFQESYAIDQKPGTLRNLAIAEAALPEYKVLALRHLRQWLRGGTVKPDIRERASDVLRELLAATGHIVLQGVSPGSPHVVSIDGADAYSMEQENGVIDVLQGHHTILANIGVGQKREVDVPAGATVTVRFDPTPTPPPPSVAPVSPPRASTDTQQPAPVPTVSTETAPLRIWATVGLGVGAGVLLATGLYFGAQSSSDINKAIQERSSISGTSCVGSTSALCADLSNSRSTGNTDHTVSTVLLSGSAVFAMGALASWFFLPKTRESGSVAPLVGSGTLGAQWAQTF
jgi:hypothetical protein